MSLSILVRSSLRYLLRQPWQVGLCVLGVALGVAVVVSIDLANASARRAFTLSAESIAGRATHQIIGGPGGLDDALYRRVRVDLGIRESAPVVLDYARAPNRGDVTFQLLGVDPLAEAPFRPYLVTPGDEQGETLDLTTLIAEPATVLLSAPTARRYGLAAGDTLLLQFGSVRHTVRVVGLLQPEDDISSRALDNLLIADIATAQELTDSLGTLSRIDLVLPEEGTAASQAIARIEAILPPGAQLTRPETRSSALQQMTQAFELNLSALSLLALVVGMFLIYNTMTFSVVQRREMLGTLRCLGVTRRQLFALVMGEATVISLAGALPGLLMGVLLGRGLVHLVTRTINDLYFVVTVRDLAIDPLILLKGFVLGVGAALISAALPAREAMLSAPRAVQRRSSIEENIRRMVPLASLAGAALVVLGGVVVLLVNERAGVSAGAAALSPSAVIIGAFLALMLVLIGFALLTPAITVGTMALLRPLMGHLFGLLGRMAARGIVTTLSRTSVAIASLMVAVSVTIGVGIMVGSFRQTVIDWLETTIVADVYVVSPGNTSRRTDTTLDPATVAGVQQTPGVAGTVLFRNVTVDTPAGPTTLVAVRRHPDFLDYTPRNFKHALPDALEVREAGAIFISEPLAYRIGLGVGERLRLRTERGLYDFLIAAVYYDYSSDRGVIQMADQVYRAYWDDSGVSSIAVLAEPGVQVDALAQTLRETVGSGQPLRVNSNRSIREHALATFDRTFAITAVLQMLATIVAFIGILSALMALQLERGREVALLRANGLTPRQLWGMVLSQTGLMGLTAGLLAMPVGFVLALVLIFVINRHSFGWTLRLSLDPLLFAQALLVALVAAVLAGVYPAWRMGRTNPALMLREE